MQCPSCGVDASEHQKFCHECGVALHPASTIDADLTTQAIEVQPITEPTAAELANEAVDTKPTTTIDANLDTEPIETLSPATSDANPDTERIQVLPAPIGRDTRSTPPRPHRSSPRGRRCRTTPT